MFSRIAVIALMLYTFSSTALAKAPEYLCQHTKGPLVVDGRLTEPAWQTALPLETFAPLGGNANKLTAHPTVRMLFTEKHLYVGATVNTLAANDENRMVLFLRPREGKPETYEFRISENGFVSSAKHAGSASEPETYKGHARVRSKRQKDIWSFEMVIPFEDIVRAPSRGDVWITRIGMALDGQPPIMWPHNEKTSFDNNGCRGYLIFEDRNLLPPASLAIDTKSSTTPPEGWRFIVNTNPKAEGQGTINIIRAPDGPSGKQVVFIDKTDYPGYLPTLSTVDFPIEPGATYEFSAWVKAEKPFYAGLSTSGEQPKESATRFFQGAERRYPPSPDFRQIVARYHVDPRARMGSVLFRYNKQQGKMWIADVRLARVNGLALPAETVAQPDSIHRLVALSTRSGFKPFWHLKQSDGWHRNDKTVFKDTGTGATIWKMSRHPAYISRHQYQGMSPWNANGQRLAIFSLDPWRRVFMHSNGQAWHPLETYYWASQWDRTDPNVWWVVEGHHKVVRLNISTGERTEIRTFDGVTNLWPMSHDGKYLLAREQLSTEGKSESFIHLIPRDATVGGENIVTIDPKTKIHQLWFTNRPDYSVVFGYGKYWLGGEVMTPDGKTIKKITHQRLVPGGHRAPGPKGKWAIHSMGFLYDWITDETVWLSDHHTNHQTWGPDGSWLVGSSGFDLRRFRLPPKRADQLLGSANSRMKYNIYWAEVHPTLSPDGTKLGYASNMLGWIDFYNLIVKLPESPSKLTARAEANRARLEWQPSENAREIARYNVYHSESMAGPYAFTKTVDSRNTSIFLENVKDGCYVVTSEEHSGLESNYSAPAWAADHGNSFVIAIEAETSDYAEPAEELFDPKASDLYALSLGSREPSRGAVLSLPVSRTIRGMVFARVRCILQDGSSRVVLRVDEQKCPEATVKKRDWHWIGLSGDQPLAFDKRTPLTLVPLDAGTVVDQIVIVDHPNAVPTTFWGRNHEPPPPVNGLKVEPMDPYTIRLSWNAPPESDDIAHYCVYASRKTECKTDNETLIVSPTKPEAIDWGLEANTMYTYRVTAIDRAGNEGPPSKPVAARTPALSGRVFIRKSCQYRTTKESQLDIPVESRSEDGLVCWLKIRTFNPNDAVKLRIQMDGKDLRDSYKIPFYFITPHHPGPKPGVWFWVCISRSIKDAFDSGTWLLPAPSGKHLLTISEDAEFNKKYAKHGDVDIECAEYVVTNDLGYVPLGITNFLIDPMRGRE